MTIALQSSERLTRLINDLLDIERIESGTRPMEVTAHDADQLLAAAAGRSTASRRRSVSGSRSVPPPAGSSPTRTASCRR